MPLPAGCSERSGTPGERRRPCVGKEWRHYSALLIISNVLGCGDLSAGLPASRLVASHFSVMVNHAQVMTAGPKVVGRALGYEITKEQLGGVEVHRYSGVVDNIVATEEDAFDHIRRFLRFGTL